MWGNATICLSQISQVVTIRIINLKAYLHSCYESYPERFRIKSIMAKERKYSSGKDMNCCTKLNSELLNNLKVLDRLLCSCGCVSRDSDTLFFTLSSLCEAMSNNYRRNKWSSTFKYENVIVRNIKLQWRYKQNNPESSPYIFIIVETILSMSVWMFNNSGVCGYPLLFPLAYTTVTCVFFPC